MTTPTNANGHALLQRLLDERDCQRVVLDIQHYNDGQDYDAMAALFTEDAELYRPGSEAPLQGRDAILQAYRQRPPERLTCHLCTNQRVDLLDDDRARVATTVLLHAANATDTAHPKEGRPLQPRELIGEIDDELVRTPAGWRVRRRRAWFTFHRG